MALEMLNKDTLKVTMDTYIFQDETGPFYYKEWTDEEGRVVDSILRDKDGYEINDPLLLDEVYEWFNSQAKAEN